MAGSADSDVTGLRPVSAMRLLTVSCRQRLRPSNTLANVVTVCQNGKATAQIGTTQIRGHDLPAAESPIGEVWGQA
jgi:hypothetical protein